MHKKPRELVIDFSGGMPRGSGVSLLLRRDSLTEHWFAVKLNYIESRIALYAYNRKLLDKKVESYKLKYLDRHLHTDEFDTVQKVKAYILDK